MFVMLLGSIANAQDFDFSCSPATIESEIEDFYASTEPPTGFIANSLIDAEAQSFHDGQASSRSAFVGTLKSSNYVPGVASPVDGYVVYDIDNLIGTVIETITADVSGALTKQEFSDFTFKVILAIWYLEHPDYISPEELAALIAERTETVKTLGNGYVDVRVSLDTVEGNIIGISDTDGEQYIYVQLYDLSNQTGFVGLEDLQEGEFTLLKNAITAKVNELTPTVAKELAAWFADTVNAPTGAAPDYLPTALYAHANTLINGTERFSFIADGLLSAHGVTITRGGAGQTGSTVTTFILSKGDGYDVTINWGAYSHDGFNGNSKASPELYRNLVFDVIKVGWKLVNETNNTKRSDWLDQDLDITGNNVELQTYGHPNFDWWIYFNVDGLRIPILSGGIASDPMFYNKHTINPHDTYMTEVEFQTLVTFVTYMRDNFDRLKAVTGEFNRNLEVINMADDLGASYSYTTQNGETHWKFTNKSTGNFNELRVQSNWTHAAGTDLGDLNPDSFVKFYAKCRGIILGL